MGILQDAMNARERYGTRWLLTRGVQYLEEKARKQVDQTIEDILSDNSRYPTYRNWYVNRTAPTDVRDYDVPINPYQVVYVDPHKITHKTRRYWQPFQFRKKLHGKVKGGNWDTSHFSLYDTRIYNGFIQRFEHNMDWEETELSVRPDEKLDQYDRLYETFRNTEYKTQQELHDISNPDQYFDISLDQFYRERAKPPERRSESIQTLQTLLDEVVVDVGRNGELLYVDGKHRLSLAQILDLDQIPVVIVYRHKSWMKYLQRAHERKIATDWHPDLRQLS